MPKLKAQSKPIARPQTSQVDYLIEVEVIPGLEAIAQEEIYETLQVKAYATQPGQLRFQYTGKLHTLFTLRTVIALYRVLYFAIPRPRGLLGHEYFHQLLSGIQFILDKHDPTAFQTLHLDAAGSDSSVMQRLKAELANATQMSVDDSVGDLLIRLRRATNQSQGWEALIRLTPRPLSTRPWRSCNFEGALNATVAQAMIRMIGPAPDEHFLNIGCGSGTILIERLAYRSGIHTTGCDLDRAALLCAQDNIAQSGNQGITLLHCDARSLPFPAQSIDCLASDLPFGNLIGSHENNLALYPHVLQEAARVAKPGACFALITHEIKLTEAIIKRQSSLWTQQTVFPIRLSGLHPRIYLLRRNL